MCMITKDKVLTHLLLQNKLSQNFVAENNSNLLFFIILWVRNLGSTQQGSSVDHKVSSGVIHLAASYWHLGWANSPRISEWGASCLQLLHRASPCGHLGHSWEPRLVALLTSLLASRERRHGSYSFSEDLASEVPEVPFAKFCGSKHFQGQPKSRAGKETLSPLLMGGPYVSTGRGRIVGSHLWRCTTTNSGLRIVGKRCPQNLGTF